MNKYWMGMATGVALMLVFYYVKMHGVKETLKEIRDAYRELAEDMKNLTHHGE